MNIRASILSTLVLAAACYALLVNNSKHQTAPSAASAHTPVARAADVQQYTPINATALAQHNDQELISPSQRDTAIDGRFKLDTQGNLVIDKSAQDIFHYFLTAHGEKPLSEIINNIEYFISQQLDEPAAQQARDFLKQYLDYEQAFADNSAALAQLMPQQPNTAPSLDFYQALIDNKQTLREKFFGDNANELFAAEHAYDVYTLERMRLAAGSLPPAARQAALQNLQQQLPHELQQQIKTQSNIAQAHAQLTQLESEPDNLQQRQAIEEAWSHQFGSTAAQRLIALEAERRQWRTRVENYLEKRHAIHQQFDNPQERQQAVLALQNSLFSATESLRLSAYQ